uniref:Uncharacterized protein n=1 Tax=Streptomyces sp. NBC_00049 TaxID=2903617 RepID=A0AAU2JXV1_9ACTN
MLSTTAEVALLAATAVAVRDATGRRTRRAWLLKVLAAANVVLLLVDVVMSLWPETWHGIPQRAHVTLAAAWILTWSLGGLTAAGTRHRVSLSA